MIALDQKRAAQALCMTEGEFSDLVEQGVLPRPKKLGRLERWDADLLKKIVKGDQIDSMADVQW